MNCYGTELVLCVYVKRRVKVSPRPWLLKRHRRLLETSSASWPSCTTISCSSRPRPRLPKLAPGASAETPVRRLWTWWWALDFIQVFMVLDFLSVSSSFLKKKTNIFLYTPQIMFGQAEFNVGTVRYEKKSEVPLYIIIPAVILPMLLFIAVSVYCYR